MKKGLTQYLHCEEGVAFIEFALSVGFLLIMFYGAIEVSRYILIVQKVEKTVYTLTDVITQAAPGTLNNGDVTTYLNSTQTLMNPYTVGSNGAVILTDIQTPTTSTSPVVNWQVCGGGTMGAVSKVSNSGSAGSPATLPSGFTMIANEEVVIGEIYYNFTPLLQQDIVSSALIYRIAVFKPRYGTGVLGTQTFVPCA